MLDTQIRISRSCAGCVWLQFTRSGTEEMLLVTRRPIARGAEVLVHYGPHYWAGGECRCRSCAR